VTDPLISILIPTRERLETLRFTLRTALNQASDRIEILVADNASADGTREFVASIADVRLRYVNSGKRISMSENWENALRHARGRYVMIIGDDDALIPRAIDRLIPAVENNPSDVYVWPKPVYVWPGPESDAYVERVANRSNPHRVDLDGLASRVLARGGWGHYALPSIYHSLVDRRIPDSIRSEHGRVYHSTQPDIFMEICIPAFVSAAFDVGYAVTAHGRSAMSNGWVATRNQEPLQIERFIAEYGDYEIHPTLYPRIPIMANLTPDSLLVARDLFPDRYSESPFGYDAMWAFICREARVFKWRMTPLDVVRRRHEIRRFHELNLSKFAAYLGWHAATAIRSRLVSRTETPLAPPDIEEFVRAFGEREATQRATV
jgi:glycosyltransferase involved in cell wall biosynthesis